jgi:hypothetical protein
MLLAAIRQVADVHHEVRTFTPDRFGDDIIDVGTRLGIADHRKTVGSTQAGASASLRNGPSGPNRIDAARFGLGLIEPSRPDDEVRDEVCD